MCPTGATEFLPSKTRRPIKTTLKWFSSAKNWITLFFPLQKAPDIFCQSYEKTAKGQSSHKALKPMPTRTTEKPINTSASQALQIKQRDGASHKLFQKKTVNPKLLSLVIANVDSQAGLNKAII